MHTIQHAVEHLSTLYLGRYGVVGVSDAVSMYGDRVIVVYVQGDSRSAQVFVPNVFNGWPITLLASGGHVLHGTLGDINSDLVSSPQWAAVKSQMQAEGASQLEIDAAQDLFINSFKEMNLQKGVDASTAIETAKRFVGSDRTLQGALDSVEGLISVASSKAPPQEVVQQFTSVIVGAAVTAGVVAPGIGAMIAIGVAVTIQLLELAGLLGGDAPGEDICGRTFRPKPDWIVGCVGMYGERVAGPKNDGWRKFPDPNNPADAEWFPQQTTNGFGQTTWNIWGPGGKISAAFPAYNRLQCDLRTGYEFYQAYYTAWKANNEYALNGLKAASDWEVFIHVLRIWNKTHELGTPLVITGYDEPVYIEKCSDTTVPYFSILVRDIRKYSGNPDIDAPNNQVSINMGPKKQLAHTTPGLVLNATARNALIDLSSSTAKHGTAKTVATVAGGTSLLATIGLYFYSKAIDETVWGATKHVFNKIKQKVVRK